MLVLSRMKEQSVMIGDNIEIMVVRVKGPKVYLGVTAPRTVDVHRKEIAQSIKTEKQAALYRAKNRDRSQG